MGVGCSHGVVEHTPDFRFHGASPLTLSKYGVRVRIHFTLKRTIKTLEYKLLIR